MPWQLRATIALAALLLSACGASSSSTSAGDASQPSSDPSRAVTETLSFETSDGATLHATIRGTDDLRPRPLLIEFSPYGAGSDIPDFGPAYNHIFVNARGTGQSSGVWTAVGPHDQQDVSEFVAWACQQPWSNGHIGLYGFSASAIAVYNSLHLPLACVDAAALMAGTNDLYRDLLYPGGGMNLLPGAVVGLGVGSPIILGGILNLVQQRELPLAQVFAGAGFLGTITNVLAHTTEDQFWLDRTQRAGPNHFPVLADTSFYDVESRGPFESYKMLRDLGVPVHLKTLGAHDGFPDNTDGPQPAYRRWFDHYLLGIDNGVESEAKVELLVGHGGYDALKAGDFTRIETSDWPVPGTRWQTFYLDPARGGGAHSINDGQLNPQPPAQQAQQGYPALTSLLASDPNTTSTVSAAGVGTLFQFLPFLNEMGLVETLSLTYTTPALNADVDVVGPASLVVHLSSVLPEADIVAVIADVWPDGSAHAVGIGRLRSSFPNLVAERSVVDDRGEIVQPYADHSGKSFALPAQMREYHVEFWPVGNRFQTGHRLRLYLTGAATYSIPAPNLNLVSVGGDTPSRLLLPVLPESDLCAATGTSCDSSALQ
jgi:predicted acyl esterase